MFVKPPSWLRRLHAVERTLAQPRMNDQFWRDATECGVGRRARNQPSSFRKHCGRVRVARPISTDRNIEQNKEWVIKDPTRVRRKIRWRPRLVKSAVNV